MLWRVGGATIAAAFFVSAAFAAQVEDVDPGEGYEEPAPAAKPVETGFDKICPLTNEQTEKAISAFSRMMPAFKDPRCANCHGGVNPFAENGGHAGGQIKLEHIVERWLKDQNSFREALAAETSGKLTDQQIKNAQDALRTILSGKGENLSPETIAEILAEGDLEQSVAAAACSSCHEHQPVRWRIAKSRFAGMSSDELCESFQKHREVTSPAEFVDHMSRDPLEFIPVAFAGTRALTPFGQAILNEVRGKPYAPEPVRGVTREALNRAAFDWGTALSGKYRKPPSCGCEKKSYKLDVTVKFVFDYDDGPAYGNGRVDQKFELPMTFVEEGKFKAEGRTPVKNVIDGGIGGDFCAVEQLGDEDWALAGSINSDTNEMSVAGVVTVHMKPATMVCNIDGKRITQQVPALDHSEDLEKYAFKMPALIDAPKIFREAIPAGERIVTFKVIEE